MSNETGYVYYEGADLTSSDLRQEMEAALERGEKVETAHILMRDEEGQIKTNSEAADALYLADPLQGRIGIAWGTDADWADADSLAEGIRIYCEDPDLFASLN